MIETTKAYTVAFTKARNYLVVQCREKHVNWNKNRRSWKFIFKALANRFWLTSKSYFGSTKLFMADILSNWLHEKVNDLLLKVD